MADMTATRVAWCARLARDVHARLYHDVGAEVTPGDFQVRTPYCKQGNRKLGDLTLLPDDSNDKGMWDHQRRSAFAQLATETWVTREHLGCFHRRSKAAWDLAFAVTAELAVPHAPGRISGTAWRAVEQAEHDDRVLLGGPAGAWPRVLVVDFDAGPVAMRSDGPLATPWATTDARALWRSGWSVAEIAEAVRAHITDAGRALPSSEGTA
jgi:hypothetical protein